MPDIKLPDGKIIQFKNNVNGFNLVEKISKSLAKEACIMSVDSELKDLSYEIKKNSAVRIITSKDKEGLEVLRHDAAHILAMAVQELFSGTQDRKSTRLNSSHALSSYAVFCLKKKIK